MYIIYVLAGCLAIGPIGDPKNLPRIKINIKEEKKW